MEEWVGNRWLARAAFSVSNGPSSQPNYGVLWFQARTEIDKAKRLVSFTEIEITRVTFPSAPDKSGAYQGALQSHVAQKGEVIALDRVVTDIAANPAESTGSGYEVKNDPPKIFFSTKPALLILIDGAPVLRSVAGTDLERVINTRALLLNDRRTGKFYLRLMDGWLEAGNVNGQWQPAANAPEYLNKALEIAAASKQVDLLEGSGPVPDIYVSNVAAELLQTRGEPQIAAIPNTQLIYVSNSDNDGSGRDSDQIPTQETVQRARAV
jgi:hypothetical protein